MKTPPVSEALGPRDLELTVRVSYRTELNYEMTDTDPDRVWNVKDAKVGEGWGFRTGIYYRDARRDGLPVWRLERYICPPTQDLKVAAKAGAECGLQKDTDAKNNGIALQISDILAPDEETLVRLAEPLDFVVLFAPARADNRFIVGVGRLDEASCRWEFLRRIGSVSSKQVKLVSNLAVDFGLRLANIRSMPRLAGKELDIE